MEATVNRTYWWSFTVSYAPSPRRRNVSPPQLAIQSLASLVVNCFERRKQVLVCCDTYSTKRVACAQHTDGDIVFSQLEAPREALFSCIRGPPWSTLLLFQTVSS
jgi:phosphoheptose isomerase